MSSTTLDITSTTTTTVGAVTIPASWNGIWERSSGTITVLEVKDGKIYNGTTNEELFPGNLSLTCNVSQITYERDYKATLKTDSSAYIQFVMNANFNQITFNDLIATTPVILAQFSKVTSTSTTEDTYVSTTTTTNETTSTTEDTYVSSTTTTTNVSNQVALPTFGVNPDSYDTTTDVTLSCSTSGAAIYYTTDGVTTPTESSTQYVNPIRITYGQTVIIKAIAVKSGMVGSDLAEGTFSVLAQVETPQFDVASGTEFGLPLTVNITSATASATIEYSTDGTNWTVGASVTLETATTTLRARATKSGMAVSEIATATYIKVDPKFSPTFSYVNTTSDTSPDLTSVTCEDFIKIKAPGADKVYYRIQYSGVWYPSDTTWTEVVGEDATIDASTAFSYLTLNRVKVKASKAGLADSDEVVIGDFKKVEMIVAYNSTSKNIYKVVDNNLVAWGSNPTSYPFVNKFGNDYYTFLTSGIRKNDISIGYGITAGTISIVKIVKNGANFDYYVKKTSDNKIYKLNYQANEQEWKNNPNGYTFINADSNGDVWARDSSSPVKVFKLDNTVEEFTYSTTGNYGTSVGILKKSDTNIYFNEANTTTKVVYIYRNNISTKIAEYDSLNYAILPVDVRE
ncbi:MAG: chitobiase/beta-hexosaminidase C-terminal domain-containing protein [Spirochaetes bacterium]|nr:chitobiase/beta-hexosaminidase C-terminal domain-containing protein [Spirochaetota bacterium]